MATARVKDNEDKPMLERRNDKTPVERWRPFEQYDKFREPGKLWRGDDEEIRKNPRPSTAPNKDKRSNIEDIPIEHAKQRLAMEGVNRDTEIAHVTPEEKQMLMVFGGSGDINPNTGLVQFDPDGSDTSNGSDTSGVAESAGGSTTGVPDNSGATESTDRGGIDTNGSIAGSTDYSSVYDALGENFGNGNQSRAGQPDRTSTWDSNNNWGLGIGDASALAGFGTGILGALSYAAGVGGKSALAGIENSANNLTFGDIAGFIGGAAVSTLTAGVLGPALAGVAGPVAGAIGGRVGGTIAGNYAGSAITSAINNGTPTSTTSPNQSAPGTNVASDPGFADDTRGGTGGTAYDPRIAPLTATAVNPLAVQPTTTVADDTTTTSPFRSGIYIPPIGAPTAGRPLSIT